VIALSVVLRIMRTLDGAEIDKIILDVETRKGLATEHRRRADWHKCELAASRFRAEWTAPVCYQRARTSLSRRAPSGTISARMPLAASLGLGAGLVNKWNRCASQGQAGSAD
jgi:hypothetical protein